MIFSLDILRARKGDCLLLHYGTKADPGLAVIDGGPSAVYGPHLKPRLAEVRKARKLEGAVSLPVDLLMVSHIDDDHIKGILELSKALVAAKQSSQPLPVKVRSLWHNAFDDILGDDPQELISAVTTSFGAASLAADGVAEGLEPEAAKVLASVDQGVRLRDDATVLGWPVSPEFGGTLVQATASSNPIDVGKGLSITPAGPMKPELQKLQKAYAAFLKKRKAGKNADAALAAFTDTSVPNLSSLVLLAEVGERRILLTGDARGDKILKGLELVGLLKKGGNMHVDVFKMPHHGSDRNIDPVLFRRVTADHYVFSGNGEHGNPERETLQMLLDERGDEELTIHLTYPIKEIDLERKKDWEKERAREAARKKKNAKVVVRAKWSPKKHSLDSFFSAHKDFAKKVNVVGKDGHVIDLIDSLGF
jgi:hypothetical protein